MERDSFKPEPGENQSSDAPLQAQADALRQERALRLAGQPSKDDVTVSVSLLSTHADQQWKTGLKQGACDIAGTLSAGVSGTIAWSVADKLIGNTKYGLIGKLATAAVVGGGTKFITKGGLELALLEAPDRKTSSEDLVRGGVDALAAVAGFKAEQKFSSSYQQWLGRRSGAHLGAEFLEQQGAKILEGSAAQRVMHNGLRGLVGGTVGSFVWAAPNEIYKHRNELSTREGVIATGKDIGFATLLGGAFGGTLSAGGTAIWNARELASVAKAGILGKQGRYSLDVLHFNDSHSALLGDRATMSQLVTKADQLTVASAERRTGSVLLELGDTHSGTAASHLTNTGEVEARIAQQRMRVNGFVPGNHAADTGLPGNSRDVRQWMANMRTIQGEVATAEGRELPGVASNVRNMLDPGFASGPGAIYQPFRIHVDATTGERIGLTGVVTNQLQTATPKLIDQELARAAAVLKGRRWSDLASARALEGEVKDAYRALAGNADIKLLAMQNPSLTVAELVEKNIEQKYLRGLTPEQAASWREWFRLGGEHPQATLSELATRYPANKQLEQIAAHFPDKRVGELHEIMCTDPLQALQRSVEQMKQQGVDKIIVLSHLGKNVDKELAAKAPAVSAIFGAHSHDLEPVPLWVWNESAKRHILISQAGFGNGWLGEANLVFNKDGSLHRYLSSGRMHVIDSAVPHDPIAQKILTDHLSATAAGQSLLRDSTAHLKLATEMPLMGIRGNLGRQTPYGNLLATAVGEGTQAELAAINAQRSAAQLAPLGERVDAVLLQSGSLRGGLPAGDVTEIGMRSIYMNKLCLTQMKGEQIERILAYGTYDMPATTAPATLRERVGAFFSGFKPGAGGIEPHDPSGKFVVTGGLQYKLDRSKEGIARIKDVMIKDGSGRFVPLDRNRTYTVVANDYPLTRWGNNPMVDAKAASGALDRIGADKWVFGRRVEPGELRSLLPVHDLEADAAKRFTLDYLRRNSRDGVFVPPKSLGVSPMLDISPGAWSAPVRPSITTIFPMAGLSAKENAEVQKKH